jgi:phosphate transport system protein
MSMHLQRDLERLKKDILTMGAMVEEAVRKSITALLERRPEVSKEILDGDSRIDRWEVDVEEQCLKMLALHQPVAEDLRFIAAVIKMNNDLERMGDLAVNIAERAAHLAGENPIPIPDMLRSMTEASMRMVRSSLDAFVNRDPARARAICAQDDEVDEYNREIIAELQRMMEADPRTIRGNMHLFSATRHLERIADHATNIAEDVVYLVEGEIIRHKFEELPQEPSGIPRSM